MTDQEVSKLIEEMQQRETERIEILESQAKKGCNTCSQLDDYWGCDKCARA